MIDETARGKLKNRLRELGISAREASRRAGFNVGYVGDILDGRSKTPDADRILKLAETLDMSAADLLGDSRAATATARVSGDALPLGDDSREGGRMIPLFAAPMPINRQFVPFNDEPMGRVPCPANLLNVREAFAAIVPNNASAPRYFAGEAIAMNPAATPAPGDFVWVRCNDGGVAIARLANMGADSFSLEFLGLEGAERTAELAYSEVKAILKIVHSAV